MVRAKNQPETVFFGQIPLEIQRLSANVFVRFFFLSIFAALINDYLLR